MCVDQDAPGFSDRDGDCDDDDDAIVPRRFAAASPQDPERPVDGIDHNCDGLDYPFVNGPFEDTGGGQSFPMPPAEKLAIPEAARCSGRALSIMAVELLWDCGGGSAVHIGNRGSELVSGAALEITPAAEDRMTRRSPEPWSDPRLSALPDIAPGAVVRVELDGGGLYLVRLLDVGAPGACMPLSTEGAQLSSSFTHRKPLDRYTGEGSCAPVQ